MDLEEEAKLSTRVFLESPDNVKLSQNEENMNHNRDHPLGFLPSPQIYQQGHSNALLDTKAVEARKAYLSYFNRVIGPDARL